MEPQIIVQDFAGAHNNNKEATHARLVKGASWKKQNIIVIVPAGAMVPAKAMLSWWNLGFPPNNGVVKILAQGMEVGEAYSKTIEGILAEPNLSKFQYILTLEHDNLPPADGVIKLVEDLESHHELAAVSGLYFTKGPGGCAQIWGDPKDPTLNYRPQVPNPAGGLQECCGLGMGFCLFRLDTFKDSRISKPFFKTQKENGMTTQDLYFWRNVRPLGYRCAVDLNVRVGHYDVDGNQGGIPDFVW